MNTLNREHITTGHYISKTYVHHLPSNGEQSLVNMNVVSEVLWCRTMIQVQGWPFQTTADQKISQFTDKFLRKPALIVKEAYPWDRHFLTVAQGQRKMEDELAFFICHCCSFQLTLFLLFKLSNVKYVSYMHPQKLEKMLCPQQLCRNKLLHR